jgi:NAD(P)-dependent dehydrogenase (short-subunit alcohol dehydrogenase family)
LVNEFNVTINSTKKIIDTMVAQKMFSEEDKSVVTVSSVGGKSILYQQPESYAVAKAGIMALMNYYAVTLGPLGIRFNSVLPGMFIKPESKAFYDASEEKKVLEGAAPLGRMTNTDDIANVVEFFCNEKSYLVTGAQIVLDGGISLINQESLMMRKLLGK